MTEDILRGIMKIFFIMFVIWNTYTAFAYDYITWDGEVIYFDEEPSEFFWYFLEVYLLPFLLFCYFLVRFYLNRKRKLIPRLVNSHMKEKRLRRRKRKKKRIR